jgi:hypothetical protein
VGPESVTRVTTAISILRKIYTFGLVMFVVAFFVLLETDRLDPSARTWALATAGLYLEALSLAYLGLRLRKPWVVPLIVFGSAYALTSYLLYRPYTLSGLIGDLVTLILCFYQLSLFMRPETRSFFGDHGTTLF